MKNPPFWAWTGIGFCLVFILLIQSAAAANSYRGEYAHSIPATENSCDNATDGGSISGNEVGCPNPIFDPSIIVNVVLPTGGSGNLEYIWIYTTVDPLLPVTSWIPILGSNSPNYDPGPITITTWYRRCARREGCDDYIAESNYVVKEVYCCDNFTDGGLIGEDQAECAPFDPALIENVDSPTGGSGTPTYFWYQSTISGTFDPNTWTLIPGANGLSYDPPLTTQTTWFIRFSKREPCTDSVASNVVQIQVYSLMNLEAEIQHITCIGESDGAINLTVSGGSPNYSFLWNTGSTQEDLTNLTAGTYSVTVTDELNCSIIGNFEIIEPDALEIQGTIVHPNCFEALDGSITLEITGGTSPYSFNWDNAPDVQNPSSLGAGTYSVTVTDANDCTDVATFQLISPPSITIVSSIQQPDCLGGSTGSIVLTVAGGTPNYTFLWNTGDITKDLVDVMAGLYTVTVTDSQGCIAMLDVLLHEPGGLMVEGIVTPNDCFADSTGAIHLTVSGGTSPYSFLWSNGSIESNLINLVAGSYSVTVVDQNGCSFMSTYVVTQPPNLLLGMTKVDVTCFGENDGSATVSVSGGTAPYTYLWNTVPAQTTATATGLSAGPVSVTVTDDQGCQAIATIIIGQPANLLVGITKIDVTCFGENDGSATVSVSGGTAPYSYLWNTVPAQTTATATGLSAGPVSVTVTDDQGCQAVATIIIGQPANLLVGITKNDVTCFGENDGSATVSVSGGTAPYSYLWNTVPAQTTATATGLSAGPVSVTVTDDQGCQAVATIIIGQPANLLVGITKNDVTCFGENDGSATVSVSGGTAPYSYLWNTVPAQTTATATGLSAGPVSVTVTDDQDCQAVATIIIGQPANLVVGITKIDVTCFSENNGSATVSVSGGTAPYTYLWNTVPAQTTATATGLSAGPVSVTVTDDQGCQAVATIIIGQPANLLVGITKIDVTCFGGNDGSATVSVSGGTAPYSYLWNTVPAQTTATATGLSAGPVSVTVTDDQGCQAIASIIIGQPSTLTLGITKTDVTCLPGNDGTATVSVSGGTAPYTYLWNTIPAQTTATATGLSAGSVSVTVTDDQGCQSVATTIIGQPGNLVAVITKTDATCFGGNDGSATVSVSGGTAPYTYLWNTIPAQTTATATGLSAGSVSVTVTDDQGCQSVAIIIIGQPANLILEIIKTDVTCFGGNDGSATVSVSGGTAPYTYLWNTVPAQTTATASNLSAGSVSVTVTDDEGCQAVATIIINQPTNLVTGITKTDVTCFGGNDGSATVSVSGGTAPYTYLWNTVPAQTTATATGLSAGSVSVTVTDDEGCQAVATIIINQPTNLVTGITKTDVTCFGGNDGSATVSVSGGTAPYTYLWNTVPAQTTATATGLSAGSVSVTVTDDEGCQAVATIIIIQPTNLVTSISKTDVTCFGGNDGSATVSVSGGTAPYTYLWNTVPVQTTATASNLSAGSVSVTVTDDEGCQAVATIIINQPTNLVTGISKTDVTCFGGNDGSATVSVSGGTAPYTYLWNTVPAQTTATASNLSAGSVSVTVTDDEGCAAIASIIIDQPANILLSFEKEGQSCIPKLDGEVEVIVVGGTPPYSYLWDDPSGATTAKVTGLAPGVYTVTVTDSAGCSIIGNQTIEAATENCDCTTRIGDYVWYDFNRDGIQNTNEQGLNGITVHLSQAGPDGEFGTGDDILIKTTFTSGSGFDNGKYIFEDVCPGTYAVCFDIDTTAYQFTLPLQGLDPAKDSDAQPLTGCTLPFTITSSPGEDLTLDAGIHEICIEVDDPGIIGYDEEICYPGDTPSKIISIEDPSGGVEPLEYMWIQSDIEPVYWVGNSNWHEIPGAIDKEYQPGPIQKTTYYLRCVRSENCWDWSESNLITKTVIDPQAIILNNYPGPICINRPYLFQAKNQALPATYHWEFGPNATPSTANGVSISNVQWPTEGPITVKLTVTIGNCVDSVTLYYDAIECGWKTAFIDFSAVLTANEKVDLTWTGGNWDYNYVYLVERSQDQQTWDYLSSVVGKPFEVSNYSAVDPKPLAGESFYRIRLMDVTGDEEFSNVERIFYRAQDRWELEFFPNPFSNKLTVSLLEPLTTEGEVHFYDFKGRLLDVERIPTGVRTYEIDVQRWPEGSILAYIYLDGLRPYARKLVKIN